MPQVKNFEEYLLLEKSESLPMGFWYKGGIPLFTADVLANHVVIELRNSANPNSPNGKFTKIQKDKVCSDSYDTLSSLELIPNWVPKEEMLTKIRQQVDYMINTPKEGTENKSLLSHYQEAAVALKKAREGTLIGMVDQH